MKAQQKSMQSDQATRALQDRLLKAQEEVKHWQDLVKVCFLGVVVCWSGTECSGRRIAKRNQ